MVVLSKPSSYSPQSLFKAPERNKDPNILSPVESLCDLEHSALLSEPSELSARQKHTQPVMSPVVFVLKMYEKICCMLATPRRMCHINPEGSEQ